MKYFIKLWPDKTATLVTNHGKTLMVFNNIEDAQRELRNITIKQHPRNLHHEPLPANTPLSLINTLNIGGQTGSQGV